MRGQMRRGSSKAGNLVAIYSDWSQEDESARPAELKRLRMPPSMAWWSGGVAGREQGASRARKLTRCSTAVKCSGVWPEAVTALGSAR